MPDTEAGAARIREAAARISALARCTPVMTSRTFDAAAGLRAFFKCENFQRGGAFKVRGAANFLLSLPAAELPRGVVAYSSGNHAQAVAISAAHLNARATIVMPSDAPASKMAATRGYGADIVTYDRFREDRVAIGRRIAEQTGATIVPPFDHPWIIAGQGTVARELMEEIEGLDALVIPIGGGGLISGCAIWAHAVNPALRVFGVEPADANDTYLSLRTGRHVGIAPPATIADGLRATQPGEITLPIMREHVSEVLLVSDDEIRAAQEFLHTRMKIVVEPSGAASAAAVLHRKLPGNISRAGIVLSGGNV